MSTYRSNNWKKNEMLGIWDCDDWKDYYLDKNPRKGIRLDFEQGVNDDVKKAIKEIVAWIRKKYVFPIRVRIYIKKATFVKSKDGEMVPDIFGWMYDRDDEPYISIATGDYCYLLQTMSRDDALATILLSLLIELTHYFQWLNGLSMSDPYLYRQALVCAKKISNDYYKTKEHLY